MPYNILLKWTEHRLTTKAEPASLRSFQQFLELHAQIYNTINCEQTFTSIRQQQNSVDYVKDFSVPMAHYKPSSQINNQNLFGKVNSNAVLQPAIKPQITTSNREWSSSVTISNNAKANGKLQNNRHCPHCNSNHFSQDRYKIVIKNKLCTNCLSNNHLRQNCSSQKNCQSCNGRHHSTLHNPSKQVRRPPAAFSTGSAPFSPTQHPSNEVPPSQNKQQHCRYGQSFVKTKEPNTQRSNLDSPSNNQSSSERLA